MNKRNILLILAVVALVTVPFFIHRSSQVDAAFSGTDEKAVDIVKTIDPDYKSWAQPLFTMPSKEIESLLFALQAGLGAGVLGYFFGYVRGRKARRTPPPCT